VLSEFDDYLCHQTLDAIEYPYSSDLRFYSRYFITFYDQAGEVLGVTAVANYPNAGVQDGYAVLSLGGETQRNLRVSRLLRHDPHVLRVGPVAIEVIEPLRTFRIVCEDNELGFSWDVLCETIAPPWERRRRFGRRLGGRLGDVSLHLNQGYRCTGTLTVDGEMRRLEPGRWHGVRDRSWGIGRFWEGDFSYGASAAYGNVEGAGPAFQPLDRGPYGQGDNPVGGRFGHHNSWVPFADRYLAVSFRPHVQTIGGAILRPWGDPEPAAMILGMERRRVDFATDGHIAAAELVYSDEHSIDHEMTARVLTKAWEAGAGYADMGTGYAMGKPMGELHVEGESMGLAELGAFARNQKTLGAASSTIAFYVCEYRWGDRVGYGSFEADPHELAELPYAKYIPQTVITELPVQ
jgi:hypothetical protein